MDYVTDPSSVVIDGQRRFRDGSLTPAVRGTILRALWLNSVQREIIHVIEQAGLTPDVNDWTQLYQAIVALITGEVPLATEEVNGIVRLATALEAQALAEDGAVVLTPAALATVTATTARTGLARLATSAEAKAAALGDVILAPTTGLELIQEHLPPGIMLPWAGPNAPAKWLMCYGQAVSRAANAKLFANIGTTYGAGDGVNTFNLPDGRGYVIVGRDDMGGAAANRVTVGGSGIAGNTLGAKGGSQTHTLTLAQSVPHTHSLTTDNTDASGVAPRVSGNATGGATATGLAAAHNNMPPSLILNYIIYAGV